MTAANITYTISGRMALWFAAAVVVVLSLASSSAIAATNATLSNPVITLSSYVAGTPNVTYTFKGKLPRTVNTDIPLNGTITVSFPLGTVITYGSVAGNVNYNGGGAAGNFGNGYPTYPVTNPGDDPNTGGPRLSFPSPKAVPIKKTMTIKFTAGITNTTSSGSKSAKVVATNSSTGGGTDTGNYTFTILPATATKLAFVPFANNPKPPIYAGRAMSPPVTVQIQDQYGNPVTGATNTVTLAIGTNPASGTLSGGTPAVTPSNGTATFSNLSINNVGSGYTLVASSSPALTTATSASFDVIAAPADYLVCSDPGNTTAGTQFTVTVTIMDGVSNTPKTGSSFTINLSTFPSVNIYGGSPNPGTTITATTDSMTGIATFTNINIHDAGTQTPNTIGPASYVMVASEQSGVAAGDNSKSFTISANTATTLVFITNPGDAVAGDGTANYSSDIPSTTAGAPIEVAVEDSYGNFITGSNAAVKMDITLPNPAGGTLSPDAGPPATSLTSSATADGQNGTPLIPGVAIFDNLNINKVGQYTLTATSSGLSGAVSLTFNITADTAESLSVTNLSNPSLRSVPTDVTVTALDHFGNVATGYAGTVHFASSEVGATLPSDSTLVNGTKTFTGGVTFFVVSASTSVTASDAVTVPAVTQGSQSVVVSKGTTSTTFINPDFNPSKLNQSITFTASVLGNAQQGTPTGTVTFKDGATTLGTGTLDVNGDTTYTTSTLTLGSHSITANYGGDINYATSVSGTLTQKVVTGGSSTSVVSDGSPSNYGSVVTFTATITTNTPVGGATGTVTFKDGTTVLGTTSVTSTGTGGTAVYQTGATQLGAGSHSITALYNGDSNYGQSLSGAITQDVSKATLTYVANTASRTYGSVNPAFSGSVTGFLPGDNLGNSTTGTLSFTSPALQYDSVGSYAINGSGLSANNYNFAQDAGNATALTITAATLTYVANTASKTYGDVNPAFSGSVSGFLGTDNQGNATTGTLTFSSGAGQYSNVGSYAINGSGLTANNNNYTFVQAGGNATALTINAATLTYVANVASKTYGDVNPAFSGSVTGFLGTDDQGNATTGTLSFGSAAGQLSNVGSYAVNGSGLTANNNNYTFVQAAANATALTIGTRAISVTAATDSKAFDGTTSSAGVPTLTSGTLAGTDSLNFTQTFDTANVGTGKTLTPSGSVSDGNSGNNYNVTLVTDTTGVITKANTSVALSSSANPSNAGSNVTITATVSGPGTPTGLVTFTVDGTAQTPVSLSGGTATFSSTTLSLGDHSISAAYGGATNYNGSTSSTLTLTINDSTAPVSSGPPTTDVSSGTVGEPVTFTWVVTDNTTITYTWDFGDGTVITTTNTSITHTFTVPSTFPIKVTATDGGGQSISSSTSFVVSASAGSGDICAGLNPIAMAVKQISARLKFPSSLNKDSLGLKTIITLPDGFSPDGKTVQWEIGGIIGETTLDIKGNSPKSTTIKASLRFKKPAKGTPFTARPGTLSVSMKSQALSNLSLGGITTLNATTTGTKGQTATTDVCVVLKGVQAYHADAVSGLYKAKKDKGGAFSAKFK